MKSKLLRFSLLSGIILILSISILTGCSKTVGDNSSHTNQEFTSFTNQLFAQEVSSNTISLHYTLQNPADYGIKSPPVTYGTYNTNGTAALAGLENCIAALQSYSYDTLTPANQLTYDILSASLNNAIDLAPYTLYEEPLSPVTGIQAQLPVLLSEYQFDSSADVDTYLALLSDTPNYFNSLIDFEKKKIESGLFISTPTVNEIVDQCSSFVSLGENNYLLSTFAERLQSIEGLSDSEKSVYIDLNRELIISKVLPAYQSLIDFLKAMNGKGTNINGLYYLPHGSDYYTYLVERETGSSRTINQLQALTASQITADLYAIEAILTTKEGKEMSAAPISSPLTESDPAAILEELQTQMTGGFPAPPEVESKVKNVPADMEPYLSPAFYMVPAIDNIAENIIYINQSQMADGLELYTTLAHEGYPGHLYQTIFFADQNLDPIRSLLNFGGYTEGWATYAEMSSYYMSNLPKVQATLLQKNASIILGLYALTDMGIHSEGWTVTDTIKFFSDYGITDAEVITQIFQYIVGDPGNYLKYYIGYVEFLELKREAVKAWGKDFTQERFHKAVLEIGPAPFDVIKNWAIEKTAAKQN